MNYQVLARRYRPRRFEEVVGQESIATTLRGAIQQERIAHAYLFAGPRGVGKTSMARIFAKALNCPQAAERGAKSRELAGDPCDTCSTCEAIHLGQDIDVVELDGASHRGIDEIRTILEGVNRPATKSPHKIYIIDEVHMLTREAFNALLKTLEEPPPHVKFVFATTEPHRIPETVLSRCQRFDFHPIGEDAIVRRLSQILESEGRSCEAGLLERIARYGKGGLRDAQTILDQLITYSEGELKVGDLERITGRVSESALVELSEAVLAGDPSRVLSSLRQCLGQGADPSVLLEQVVESLRAILHRRVLEAGRDDSGTPGRPSFEKLRGCLQILLDAASKLKFSPYAEISVEVVLLKLACLEEPRALDEVLRKLGEIEGRELQKAGPAPAPVAMPRAVPEARVPVTGDLPMGAPRGSERTSHAGAPQAVRPPPPPVRDEPRAAVGGGQEGVPDFHRLCSLWDQMQVELEEKRPSVAAYLRGLRPQPASGEPGTFLLEFQDEFCLRQMRSPKNMDVLIEFVRDVTKASWRARCVSASARTGELGSQGGTAPADREGSGASRARPAPGGAPAAGSTPQSPLVKKSLDLFNGRIV